jgi:hypothetical protein
VAHDQDLRPAEERGRSEVRERPPELRAVLIAPEGAPRARALRGEEPAAQDAERPVDEEPFLPVEQVPRAQRLALERGERIGGRRAGAASGAQKPSTAWR